MDTKPIICLASWYPNELDHFEGDFIERKLQALSKYKKVLVLHVKKHSEENFTKTKEITDSGNLSSHIYYKQNTKSRGFGFYKSFFKIHNAFLKNYISTFGKPETILVQVPYNAGLIALYWKKRFGIQYILTEHYGIYNEHYEQHFNTRTSRYKWLVKKIVSHAKHLITVSHSLATDMNKVVVQKEHTKLSNVVDTALFTFKEKAQRAPFVFCHLSNMIPVKNVSGMLRAAALLLKNNTSFRLNLVGSEQEQHIKLAKELGIYEKYVFFYKAISYNKVAEELQRSHALLMFSNTESQSCISLEALCTGTPVVSSKAGGIEEHLDSSNSILVERGDVQALAFAMEKMILNYDDFNREEISKKNRALWNFEVIGKQYADIIDGVSSQ